MPVLTTLREKGRKDLRCVEMKVAGCLHVTKRPSVLIRTSAPRGAEVSWSGATRCPPRTTSPRALAAEGTSIYAWHGLTKEEFYWCIDR